MPINFHLSERLAGFTLNVAKKGEMVDVMYRELLGPADSYLTDRLEQLQGCLFSKIPQLPPPSQIEHLVILIKKDLSAAAYVNELRFTAKIKPNRPVKKGEFVYLKDIVDITAIEAGINVPNDVAVVSIQSQGWKRSLFYDFSPLHETATPSQYLFSRVLAQQSLLLFGLPVSMEGMSLLTYASHMEKGLKNLTLLLTQKCEEESKYQELLEQHPWMLSGTYSSISRHKKMNDENIPDFTGVRCYDGFHDVIELKHPFLTLFRSKGDFGASFNDAWNQAERYLDYCSRNRLNLAEDKQLRFENTRCILVIGYKLTEQNLQSIRAKMAMNRLITILTYDQLIATASHVMSVVKRAGEPITSGKTTPPVVNP